MKTHHLHPWCAWALVALPAIACSSGGASPPIGSATSHELQESVNACTGAILPQLTPNPTTSGSTVPSNGDMNPYGVAYVPDTFPSDGLLLPGDVLVSNFNNATNLQGTGTTLMDLRSGAPTSVFFLDRDADTPGFSTALAVLSSGYVILGSVPSTNGSGICSEDRDSDRLRHVGRGSLLVIDRFGHQVTTLESEQLNGPWDLAVADRGEHANVYVSNVRSGTVTRFNLEIATRDDDRGRDHAREGRDRQPVRVASVTRIASGYIHRCDAAAFVIGPTGLAIDTVKDVLYVTSTGDNAIYAIDGAREASSDSGVGRVVVNNATYLHGPLGLALASNGDLISAQGDAVNPDVNHPSEIVEFASDGTFVSQFSIDPAAGSAFGLALNESATRIRLAAVDDGLNMLDTWDVPNCTP